MSEIPSNPNQPGPPPGYGAPPPGYGAPPPGYYGAPPKRKRGLPWWGWVLIIVPVLAILSCVALFAFGFALLGFAKGEAEKSLDGFMKAAAVKNVDGMYSYYTSSVTKAEFQKDVESNLLSQPFIADYKSLSLDNSVTSYQVNKVDLFEVKGKITYNKSGTSNFTAKMVSEGSTFKVVTIDIDKPT